MIEQPDVIGYPLDDALEKCKLLGFEVDIVNTRPVKPQPEGKPRVVCFKKVSEDKGVLTVVFEDTGRGGG